MAVKSSGSRQMAQRDELTAGVIAAVDGIGNSSGVSWVILQYSVALPTLGAPEGGEGLMDLSSNRSPPAAQMGAYPAARGTAHRQRHQRALWRSTRVHAHLIGILE